MAIQMQTPPPAEAEAQPRQLALASIRPANLLSFAPDTEPLTLEPLNILIGANGSGKSNLLDAIGLLQAAALGELTDRVVVKGGGVSDWIWRGEGARKSAKVEVVVPYPAGNPSNGNDALRYWLEFEAGRRYELNPSDERLESIRAVNGSSPTQFLSYDSEGVRIAKHKSGVKARVEFGTPDKRQESPLALIWSYDDFPQLSFVSRLFRSFRLYRDWSFGRNSPVRDDQRLGVLEDQLVEDADNLGIILNNLKEDDEVGDKLASYLKEFLKDARRISTKVVGQHLQYGLSEGGLKGLTPSGRLSDGTLRWLSLLTVLLNPNPPPLICLEEPESGLHPNIIPVLAELLLDASQRTQVVVTTHSRGLVDRFTDNPEYIVVFDKEDGATKMRRLPFIGELRDWLDEYESLGPLWASGLIGGNRF